MLRSFPRTPGFIPRGAIALLALLVAGASAHPGWAAEEQTRVLLLRQDLAAFNRAGVGATAAMRAEGIRPALREVVLGGSKQDLEAALRDARAYKPAAVIAVGSEATRLSKRVFPQTPIIFAMVLNPVQTGIIGRMREPGGNVTGAALNIPFAVQFRKYKEVVPKAVRLGVLSNPALTGPLVEAAQRAATAAGFTLKVVSVSHSQEVPAALAGLIDSGVDGLWMVADSSVLTEMTIPIIVQESVRARLPTMGPSASHCKAGFLFALAVDYDANGRQAGELAARVLRGTAPGTLSIAVPENVGLVLNARIATHIGHRFPPGVLRSAATVYK